MNDRVRRALVSAFDKEGIVPFCSELSELGIEIISTGGTARLLEENDIPVARVSEVTGFPEMLDGRVKTLHPRIHAGILAVRADSRHMDDLRREKIDPIDLVVVNLDPFEKTASMEGIGLREVVEMIDVGGPTMVRAAAKNFSHVGVIVDPADYGAVLDEIRDLGRLEAATRWRLAVKAFRHTSCYDAAVADYLGRLERADDPDPERPVFPERHIQAFHKLLDLSYGENPHQRAAFYRDPIGTGPSVARAEQLQGKPLSFNNVLDFDGALALAASLKDGACCIVKHGNPCGVGLAHEPVAAFRKALECDPASAFGGVIAFNRTLDAEAAAAIAEAFYEGVIAPRVDDAARKALARKKNLRVLETGDLASYARGGFDLRRVNGGLLVQNWDVSNEVVRESRVATRRAPTEHEWLALELAWTVVRQVRSNAIVYAFPDRTAGIGAGQMSRVDAARFGVLKARTALKGAGMASDAFFPFRDGIDVAAEAGVTAVIQPGGSIRDGEVIAAAEEHGMAMVFTGRRHFRH